MDVAHTARHCVEEQVTRDAAAPHQFWYTCTFARANLQKQHTYLRVWYAVYDFEAVGLRCIALSPSPHAGDQPRSHVAAPSDFRVPKHHGLATEAVDETARAAPGAEATGTMEAHARHIAAGDIRTIIESADMRCRQCVVDENIGGDSGRASQTDTDSQYKGGGAKKDMLAFGAIVPHTCQFRYTYATPTLSAKERPVVQQQAPAASGCAAALWDAQYATHLRLTGGFVAIAIVVVAVHVLAAAVMSRHITFTARDVLLALRMPDTLRSPKQPVQYPASPTTAAPEFTISAVHRKRRAQDTDAETTPTVQAVRSMTLRPALSATSTMAPPSTTTASISTLAPSVASRLPTPITSVSP
jgi:hypothetical protein